MRTRDLRRASPLVTGGHPIFGEVVRASSPLSRAAKDAVERIRALADEDDLDVSDEHCPGLLRAGVDVAAARVVAREYAKRGLFLDGLFTGTTERELDAWVAYGSALVQRGMSIGARLAQREATDDASGTNAVLRDPAVAPAAHRCVR